MDCQDSLDSKRFPVLGWSNPWNNMHHAVACCTLHVSENITQHKHAGFGQISKFHNPTHCFFGKHPFGPCAKLQPCRDNTAVCKCSANQLHNIHWFSLVHYDMCLNNTVTLGQCIVIETIFFSWSTLAEGTTPQCMTAPPHHNFTYQRSDFSLFVHVLKQETIHVQVDLFIQQPKTTLHRSTATNQAREYRTISLFLTTSDGVMVIAEATFSWISSWICMVYEETGLRNCIFYIIRAMRRFRQRKPRIFGWVCISGRLAR